MKSVDNSLRDQTPMCVVIKVKSKNNNKMKKTNRMFGMLCMVGVVALLVSSCKKNESKTVSIGLPTFEESIVDGGGEKLYIDFNASNALKWNGNDEIMIYNLDAENGTKTVKKVYSTGASAEGATNANFDGDDLGDKMDHYFIFYPVSKIATGTSALNNINYETFTVPAEQDYTLINGNPSVDPDGLAAACEVSSLTSHFSLKHIFGVCRLRLKGTNKKVTKIELIDEHHGLAGNVGMKLHEVNMNTFSNLMNLYTLASNGTSGMNPSFISQWNTYRETLGYTSEATSHKITLNCVTEATPEGVQLNESTVTPFYIAVRPGAFIDGFKIKVYFGNESKEILNYNTPNTAYRIRPGVISGFTPTVDWN